MFNNHKNLPQFTKKAKTTTKTNFMLKVKKLQK